MPEYAAPGVYIEEMPAPQSIQGVSTSTAGFVGATRKGPTSGLPVLVTSFKDFVTKFGDYLPEDPWGNARYLAYAVNGFFSNGGQVAYVKRVVSDDAAASELLLRTGFVTRLAADTAVGDAERTTAHLASMRGIQVGSELTFREMFLGVEQTADATVASYSGNVVTLAAPLPVRFTAAGAQVTLKGVADAPAPPAGSESLRVRAATLGAAGRDITIGISDDITAVGSTDVAGTKVETTLANPPLVFDAAGPALGATSVVLNAASYDVVQPGDEVEFVAGTTVNRRAIAAADDATRTITWTDPLAADFSGGGATARRVKGLRPGKGGDQIVVADATDLNANDLVRLQSGLTGQMVKISATNGTTLTLDTAAYPVTQSFDAGATVIKGSGKPSDTALLLSSVNNFYKGAVIEIDDGAHKQYRTVTAVDPAQRTVTVDPTLAGVDVPAGTTVRVLEFALMADDGATTEVFGGLSMDSQAPRYIADVINNTSLLVTVEVINGGGVIPWRFPANSQGVAEALAGGSDGSVPGPSAYIGVDNGPEARTGIKALADIDGVSIIAAPGISDPAVQAELITQCELLKDRFAVLDPAPGTPLDRNAQGIFAQRSNHDTRYAAMYYPWLKIFDPLYPNQRGGKLCPPSGHVIGVYARVDNERGVFKAPANEVVRSIVGLEMKINEREHGQLNLANINVIRDFRDDNRGFRVYGARCLTSDNANKYIPVRRLLIFIEESLQEGLQWVVFEPNAEALWQRVKLTVRGFLRTVWRDGGLEGLKEDDAFQVFCNINQTMTEADVANGRLIIEVWVAPVRPAEFVIVRINRLTREAAQG